MHSITRSVWIAISQKFNPCLRNLSLRKASLPSRQNLNLDERIALVTGGTSGIGLAIAKRLSENGATVIVSSRNRKNVEHAVAILQYCGLQQVSGIACDVSKEDERKKLISEVISSHGDINIVVQNAGVSLKPFRILDTPASLVDQTYELHVKSNFCFVQELYPHMKKSDKPCSIVLTSSQATYTSSGYPGIYAVTKAGVNAMTRSFAPDLYKDNIRINCVTMGPVKTNFYEPVANDTDTNTTKFQNLIMQRLGEPSEAAGITAYLASDDSSYVTGESFTIAGGAIY